MIQDYKAKQRHDIDMWRIEKDYPKATLDTAKERIRGLMQYAIVSKHGLERLLISAYMQGLLDANEVIKETNDT